ncbi:NAD(P)-dependent dehydrogenase (short-subunit alcohol dehydrogenase family) [Actinopolyspora biskrensis]|uniref:NAD(P)-dependent dehydrogenase (Short-subunit alcohol dehydrogenase family) n=1 Tax=Actinopolyspora biskrensis TaxID=1470178 RepID=A0A852Z0E6_9ACTN|nr:NAD(P)-dependent dehydrogenase (short-subunit alcohol dehydrogenase family) [Actinopolyspora biskrensis]
MTGRFEDRTALVVGASRGIGFAAARSIAEEGGAVAITGRDEHSLSEAARNISAASGATVTPIPGHARRAEQRRSTVERAVESLGRLDVLVYAAASNISKNTSVLELDPELLHKDFDLNVVAALEYTKLAYERGMADGGGSVVLLSSLAAHTNVRLPAYSMTKSALESLCRGMADQLAPDVRVNSVAPAFVETSFSGTIQDLPKERINASYPMGHEGTPEEVAAAITFLASDEARWITGTTVFVDGGKSAQPARHDTPHPRIGDPIH